MNQEQRERLAGIAERMRYWSQHWWRDSDTVRAAIRVDEFSAEIEACIAEPVDAQPCKTDTERLDFLAQFFRVDDTGDECVCPGMIVDADAVSDAFDCGPLSDETVTLTGGWQNPDMRRVIDRAIDAREAHP